MLWRLRIQFSDIITVPLIEGGGGEILDMSSSLLSFITTTEGDSNPVFAE